MAWTDLVNYLEKTGGRTAGLFGGAIGGLLGGPAGAVSGYEVARGGAEDIIGGLKLLPFCKGGIVMKKKKYKYKNKKNLIRKRK